jgi:hypothetical protein
MSTHFENPPPGDEVTTRSVMPTGVFPLPINTITAMKPRKGINMNWQAKPMMTPRL